jgi:hypothetical protein
MSLSLIMHSDHTAAPRTALFLQAYRGFQNRAEFIQ